MGKDYEVMRLLLKALHNVMGKGFCSWLKCIPIQSHERTGTIGMECIAKVSGKRLMIVDVNDYPALQHLWGKL